MQLLQGGLGRLISQEELALDQVVTIRITGFMTGSAISLFLWVALVWTAWTVLG